MTQGIYKIEYGGRCAYVGCARDTRRRFNQHRDTLKRGVTASWNKGLNLTPEHRAALSAAKKGKARPDIAERLLGKKQSPDVIAKRVASFKQTIAARKDNHAPR